MKVHENIILHLHPNRVAERAIRFNLTFGLGGIAAVLFTILLVSGGLMLFVYRPTIDAAHPSVQMLQESVRAGRFVRNIHYISANLLVIVSVLHMIRVIFTGALSDRRRSNWWIGLAILLFVAAAAFSGYLLPWDQRSYWAVTICSSMLSYLPWFGEGLQALVRGGADVGGATLLRFYVLHTAVLPVLMIAFLAWHFWRIRKAGGVVLLHGPLEELEEKPARVSTIPDFVQREAAVGLACIAVVLLLAAFFDAPLGEEANPEISLNPAKAPWYFLGFQELLLHMHPFLAIFVVPLTGLCFLTLLPRWPANAGIWFHSVKGRRAAIAAGLWGFVSTPILIVISDRMNHTSAWQANIALPLAVLIALPVVLVLALRYLLKADRAEIIQAAVAWLLAAYLVLTVIGVWFRGEHMALVLPWAGGGS